MGANLKEVRDRIQSVISTQQITKAMKMVSAAKLRRAQENIQRIRPYASKLQEILSNILSSMEGEANLAFGKERELKKAAIVLVTSNRGLCGGFNANIIKATQQLLDTKYANYPAGTVELYYIGKKGHDILKKRDNVIHNRTFVNLGEDLGHENVSRVSKELMARFENEELDHIDVIYGKFKNAAVQETTTEQFLPVLKMEQSDKDSNADYLFEPDKDTLLSSLVPSILQMQFLKCVLDTNASEHGARMTAMDAATENANELLKDLKISYNKARQEAITNELSEIVGGAAALEG